MAVLMPIAAPPLSSSGPPLLPAGRQAGMSVGGWADGEPDPGRQVRDQTAWAGGASDCLQVVQRKQGVSAAGPSHLNA